MTVTDGEETSALLGRLPGVRALDLELAEAIPLTPAVRRLRWRGEGIEALQPFAGQDLMVAVPAPGHAHFRRRYTIRHLDPVTRSVDLDIVLHGDGPGARWARAVQVGDHVEAIGPRGKIGLADGADWHIFCGDEAAVPAIFAMVEALPASARAIAVLEVAGPEEEQTVDARCEVTLRWLHRAGAPGTGRLVPEELETLALPAGRGHAYVFGEHGVVSAARAVLTARAVDPGDIDQKAYWRLGAANAAHGEPVRQP